MKFFLRCCFTSLLLLLLSAPSLQANENNVETVTLKLKWQHQFQFAGYYAALAQGYYADENLDVIIEPGDRGENIVETLLSGDADYGVGGMGPVGGICQRHAN